MIAPRVFLDIETVPDPTHELWGTPAADLDPDNNEDHKAFLDTALDTLKCRVVSLALAVDGGPVVCEGAWNHWQELNEEGGVTLLDQWDGAEKGLLDFLTQTIGDQGITQGTPGILVGHNHKAFDVPILYHRAVAYRRNVRGWFPWPAPGKKPWHVDERLHDTMDLWSGPSFKGQWCSLKGIAEFLGIQLAPDEGTGADVYEWYRTGKTNLIAKHNLADVEDLRAVYRRLIPGWNAPATNEESTT